MRVLLIEDDRRLAELVRKVLVSERLEVDVAHDGETGLEMALRGGYDVAVIDWMLPGRDGPSICQGIRNAHVPLGILMLTARTQVEDRVAGLYAGADDYLGKPFAFDELVARVHALGRRWRPEASDAFELRVGSIVMDQHTHTARRGELPMDLTKTEWTMLEYLLRHPDQTLTRQQILDYVWSYDNAVQPSLVDVYISYLRNKLRRSGMNDPIHTQRGFGYSLDSHDA